VAHGDRCCAYQTKHSDYSPQHPSRRSVGSSAVMFAVVVLMFLLNNLF
jgi:hypothetical protein